MDVVHAVEDVLLRPVHWTAALPATLRQIGVADLLSPRGLDFESYGTARMMAGSAKQARQIIGNLHPPDGAKADPFCSSAFPPQLSPSLTLWAFRWVNPMTLRFGRVLVS